MNESTKAHHHYYPILGECRVSVETAGPTTPRAANMIPDHIRGFAGWIINQCVVGSRGLGGFMTLGLPDLITFLLDPTSNIDRSFRMSTYLTQT